MSLIDIATADSHLNDEVYPEWDALDDTFKQLYLDQASGYVQTRFSYPSDADFAWSDDTTWPSGTEPLIAQYADAARAGLLYEQGSSATTAVTPLKKKTQKVGSLELTEEYAQETVEQVKATVAFIKDQMVALGFTYIRNGRLIRT